MVTIGTLKEVKDNENRVGLTPTGAKELTQKGHTVIIERYAGIGSSFNDEMYIDAGAMILENRAEILDKIDILIKVKEPTPDEYELLENFRGKTLFTYLHLSGVDIKLTKILLKNNITSIAYETVEDQKGRLPLLTPMSEVAGVLAVNYGGQYLQKKYGGRGMTLCHINGAKRAKVVIVGAGVVGSKAALTAGGMGSRVYLFDIDQNKLDHLKERAIDILGERLASHMYFVNATLESLKEHVANADVLIGAVLIKGAEAPKVVTEEMINTMKEGSVIIDVAIDQGGCIWGSKPTSHSNPTYKLDGKIYCCITNMPGQASLQATEALTSKTFPYLLKMANEGVINALQDDMGFLKGLNTFGGKIKYKAVAEDLELMEMYEAECTLQPTS